jgi:RNA polymerase sigma-70 factor, ECF subfamily
MQRIFSPPVLDAISQSINDMLFSQESASTKLNSSQSQSLKSRLNKFLQSIEKNAFRYAFSHLSEEQLALDLVQESMLKFSTHYSTKPDTDWAPLFYTILNNQIRDHYRKQKVRTRYGAILSLFQTSNDTHTEYQLQERIAASPRSDNMSNPESDLYAEQLRYRIQQAVKTLSLKQREVFLLREVEGMSVAETAGIVGCSVGSVKQHHFRAMRRLRTDLEREWQND